MAKQEVRQTLFTLKAGRDLIFTTYKSSGPGGQHRNKVESAVTLLHKDSGVKVKAADTKHQARNKKIALKRLVGHPKFNAWVRLHAAAIIKGFNDFEAMIKERVAKMMHPRFLKVEYIYRYVCNNCGASKEVVLNKRRDADFKPSSWQYKGEDIHLCPRCRIPF